MLIIYNFSIKKKQTKSQVNNEHSNDLHNVYKKKTINFFCLSFSDCYGNKVLEEKKKHLLF